MAELRKCANCGAEIKPRPPRYDDGILLVCHNAPCQNALELKRQSALKEQQFTLKEKEFWKKASELLAQKEAEKFQATEVPEEEFEEESVPIDDEGEEGEWRKDGEDYEIETLGAEPWDDQVFKKVRMRRDPVPRFQRYQFRLFPTAGRSSLRNRGTNPDVDFANQLWNVATNGVSESPKNQTDTTEISPASAILDSIPQFIQSVPVTGIVSAAQSMSGGFSTGVLSSKFDYTQVPREPTERTAWVFDDVRFVILLRA